MLWYLRRFILDMRIIAFYSSNLNRNYRSNYKCRIPNTLTSQFEFRGERFNPKVNFSSILGCLQTNKIRDLRLLKLWIIHGWNSQMIQPRLDLQLLFHLIRSWDSEKYQNQLILVNNVMISIINSHHVSSSPNTIAEKSQFNSVSG